MESSLELMAKYLVHLQFYSEDEDVIVSRDKQVRVFIPGAKQIVASFVDELTDSIDLIPKREYRKYLEKRAERLPIDVSVLEKEFLDTISQLDESGYTDEIAANFLIGGIRTALQRTEFESCIKDVKHKLEVKLGNESGEQIQERLEYLYSTSDPTVSLLHNLALLRLLASIFGSNVMYTGINKLVMEHCETLFSKLTK